MILNRLCSKCGDSTLHSDLTDGWQCLTCGAYHKRLPAPTTVDTQRGPALDQTKER